MPLFRCEKCGCVENTALSNWAARHLREGAPLPPALCSACDPEIGKWHGEFPQRSAVGMVICEDGYLYTKEQIAKRQVTHTKPVRVIE